MSYKPAVDPERVLERYFPFAVFSAAAVIFAASILREASPPPSNEAAFGCYASHPRPPILINASGVQPMDGQTPAIPFRLQWDEGGILLWPERHLILTEGTDPASFQVKDIPGRAFLFVNIVSGAVYPGLNAAKLEAFQFFTKEGTRVAYRRVVPETCAGPA
jgi:hypothetical protein